MSERLNRIPCSGHSDIKIEAQFEITDDETNKRSCYTQDRNHPFPNLLGNTVKLRSKISFTVTTREKKNA